MLTREATLKQKNKKAPPDSLFAPRAAPSSQRPPPRPPPLPLPPPPSSLRERPPPRLPRPASKRLPKRGSSPTPRTSGGRSGASAAAPARSRPRGAGPSWGPITKERERRKSQPRFQHSKNSAIAAARALRGRSERRRCCPPTAPTPARSTTLKGHRLLARRTARAGMTTGRIWTT